jgi:uncharacterized repeat protein (TIGR02543 family)
LSGLAPAASWAASWAADGQQKADGTGGTAPKSVDHTGAVETTAPYSDGRALWATGGGVILQSGDVTTKREGAYGAYAESASSIDVRGNIFTGNADGARAVDNSSIDVSGDITAINGSGIYAEESFARMRGKISVSADYDPDFMHAGLYAFGSVADMSGDIVVSCDASIYGAQAWSFQSKGSSVDVRGNITTTGEGAHGAAAKGSSMDVTGNITTRSDDAYGVYAQSKSFVRITGDITTSGYNAPGAYAWGESSIDVTGNIATSGEDADGIVASKSFVNMTGNITTNADNTRGLYASLASSADISGDVTTKGANASALYSEGKSVITIKGDSVITASDDAGSYAFYAYESGTIKTDGPRVLTITGGAGADGGVISLDLAPGSRWLVLGGAKMDEADCVLSLSGGAAVDFTKTGVGGFLYATELKGTDGLFSVCLDMETEKANALKFGSASGSHTIFVNCGAPLSDAQGTVSPFIEADGGDFSFANGEKEMLANFGGKLFDLALVEGDDGWDLTYGYKGESKKCNVAFNANGGAFADGRTGATLETDDLGYLENFPEDPAREGYMFTGWKDEGGTEFTPKTAFNGDTLLYASWKQDAPTPPAPAPCSGGSSGCNALGFGILILSGLGLVMKRK